MEEDDIDDEQDYEGRRLLQHRRRGLSEEDCLSGTVFEYMREALCGDHLQQSNMYQA